MKYPDGKLNNNDEGQLRIAVYQEKGRIIINFGKELSWIGFGKDEMRAFINGLEKKYQEIYE